MKSGSGIILDGPVNRRGVALIVIPCGVEIGLREIGVIPQKLLLGQAQAPPLDQAGYAAAGGPNARFPPADPKRLLNLARRFGMMIMHGNEF